VGAAVSICLVKDWLALKSPEHHPRLSTNQEASRKTQLYKIQLRLVQLSSATINTHSPPPLSPPPPPIGLVDPQWEYLEGVYFGYGLGEQP
jgi:hypothetical protein